MSVPFGHSSFAAGELSPSLFGHIDFAKFSIAASTMRNCYVSYRGGAYSRAGTAFVGFSKQTGRSYPPRLIPFQFNINQGLALEFGNEYMRFISKGAYVLEGAISITGATQANPSVVTASAFGITAAAPTNPGAVTVSYAPGDDVTIAGGTFTTPAVVAITDTLLAALSLNSPGIGNYAPADTVSLTGGTQSTPAQLTVATTKAVSATVAAGGAGGTNGTQTVTGTTGTGTPFQASVTVAGGAITAVLSITVAGNYTVNPTTPAMEPVTGASLVGAKLDVVLGVRTFTISAAGVFTANSAGGTFTQNASSGTGTGATFAQAIMAPHAATVANAGIYGVVPANPAAQASTTGNGLGATFNLTNGAQIPFSNGDWVYITGVGGMTQLNGRTFVVAGATATTFQLTDVYGNNIDSTAYTAYTAGGTAARLYTLTTPYAEADLPYLKWTQSADVMSICCWNQVTGTSYAPYDLSRLADDDWTLAQPSIAPTIGPPATSSVTTSAAGTVDYQYVATAVNAADGSESVASPIAEVDTAVDIATTAGQNMLTYAAVNGAGSYNIYKATPGYGAAPPSGALFGYAGTAYGLQFQDSNIVPDFSQVPPLHRDPFAPGQIAEIQVVNPGSNITVTSWAVTSAGGSGLVFQSVVESGVLGGFVLQDAGSGYLAGDTIAFTGTATVPPTAVLKVGPQSGTYPSVPAYFQERRVYAASPNNPDTYWMSQPGAFTNFDVRVPTIDSDAITGTPWSVQVNGLQWLVTMPGGLVVLTGLSAWQLTGVGGSSLNPQPITPANQQAQPQAYNGVSPTVPPVRIDYDILYVQAKGSIVRDLAYNYWINIYTGADITIISSQLFSGYTLKEWAWAEEPFKILWVVRSDGVLLSLTYLKPQDIAGWARHDTNGLFQSVCSISESVPLVPATGMVFIDAVYVAVERFLPAGTAYTIERMDDRIWPTVEDVWALDCALSLPLATPNATLTVSSATGLGSLTGVTGLVGGAGYSAGTTLSVVDDNGAGPGSGAVATPTIVGGVITAVAFSPAGSAYTYPAVSASDPANTGGGFSAAPVLSNAVTLTASAGVFSLGSVGQVVRVGNGVIAITAYTDTQHVTGNVLSPITNVLPATGAPLPAPAGAWTMAPPVTTVTGLQYLAGQSVRALADGNPTPALTVSAAGSITLPTAASTVIVGLPFQAQLQSVYLNAGEPTIQGQRKRIATVVARVEASRGVKVGANQPDGSTLSPAQIAPAWRDLAALSVPGQGSGVARAPYNSNTEPLYTGDSKAIPVTGGFSTPGQVAFQQDDPLPMQILALIPSIVPGDTPELQAQKREPPRGNR